MKKVFKRITVLCFLLVVSGTLISFQDVDAKDRSNKWPKVRAQHLLNHHFCALCGSVADLNVHHIKPFHLHSELELEPSNLITLCESKSWGFNCHLVAGHGGNFRYENVNVLSDIEQLKAISNPSYIVLHGIYDRDAYIKQLRARVKSFNISGR